MNKVYDCIILGMGPSGISCSIYLKRAGKDILVIGKDLGALEKANMVDNYYAMPNINGKDIVLKGINQAMSLGINIIHDEVIKIDCDSLFTITTKKEKFLSKSIYIATGKARNPFFKAKDYEGRGVSFCATCDGFFYKNKVVGLLGYNSFMLHELEYLQNIASHIYVFLNNNKLECDLSNYQNITIVEDEIVSLYGDNDLEGIKTKDNDYKISGLFIALGSQNAFSLARQLGLNISKENNLIVNNKFQTNIDGIFAGGDVIGGFLQASKASSDGACASLGIIEYLKKGGD